MASTSISTSSTSVRTMNPSLMRLWKASKNIRNVTVNVNGYCDAVGGVEYNLRLSRERAAAVVQYLSEHGVAASRLVAHGYGKTNFVASNDTAEGRAQNRRDELVPSDEAPGRPQVD